MGKKGLNHSRQIMMFVVILEVEIHCVKVRLLQFIVTVSYYNIDPNKHHCSNKCPLPFFGK